MKNKQNKRYKEIFIIALQNSRRPLQHTFDNVRTASGNNQKRCLVESNAERLTHDLWWHFRLQNEHIWWSPSCASICLTLSIISGVLLVVGRSDCGSSSVVSFLSWKHKHIFCSRLHSRTPAPTVHAALLQFSPICSRTCLHIAPLRSVTIYHTDYVQLAAVGLHCRSHAIHAGCRFSTCFWRTMRMRAHMRQVSIQNFLDIFCTAVKNTVFCSKASLILYFSFHLYLVTVTCGTDDANRLS